jgi:hypothetical protein
VIPKFVRKKFAGVQQPLGRWILRHVVEFIVLSPAILVTWLWLKIRRKEVLLVGIGSSSITAFALPLEPELRRRSEKLTEKSRLIVLNLSIDANSQVRKMYDRVVGIYGSEAKLRRRIIWWASSIGGLRLPKRDILEAQNDPLWHTGSPVVCLTREEVEYGKSFLQTIGVKNGQKVACFTELQVTTRNYKKLVES